MAQVRLASLEVRVKLKINPLHFLQSSRTCHLGLLRLCWLRTEGDDHSEMVIIIHPYNDILNHDQRHLVSIRLMFLLLFSLLWLPLWVPGWASARVGVV